jgi:hypothetical protein
MKNIIPTATKVGTILLLSLYGTISWAQVTLTGRVVNEQQTGIADAIVIVMNSEQAIVLSTETDSTGSFTISDNTFEDKTLYINCLGYHHKTLTPISRQAVASIVLEKSELLNVVSVTASRPTIERETNKFIIPQVYTSPLAVGRNIADFLKFAPLLNLNREGELEILGKGRATIYINGRKSNADLSTIPAESIEKVEIITHPGSQYAAAERNGIINIVLHRPPKDGILVNIRIQQITTLAAF